MGNLGDVFPADARDDLVARHMRPGIELDYENVRQQLLEDVGRIKGELDAGTRELVAQAVQAANTSPRTTSGC